MAKLRPRARIIRTIGDQLISGPEAALIELVKNSYDADSPRVDIRIEPALAGNEGRITVIDAGHGMSAIDLTSKWFEPATTDKIERRFSPAGRRMLGAKGVGRFATAKLGRQLILTSTQKSSGGPPEVSQLEIDWHDFETSQYLDEVEVAVRAHAGAPGDEPGVRIEILGLRDAWTKKRLENLIKELRRLASPISRDTSFQIHLDLSAFTEEAAGFDGQTLVSGSPGEDELVVDRTLVRPIFNLDEVFHYKVQGEFDQKGAFIGTFVNQRVQSTPQAISIPSADLGADEDACGRVKLRLNIYDREGEAIDELIERLELGSVGRLNARRMLNENVGIGIYRDGFRIRPYGDAETDWLELERRRVQDPSLRLGHNQVWGIVEIEDEAVSGLTERSSREGLEHNGSFNRLKRLVTELLVRAEQERREFRESAGLSRRRKGSAGEVKDRARLQAIEREVEKLPQQYRGRLERAIRKESDALKTAIEDLETYQQALASRSTLGLVVAQVLHDGRRFLSDINTRSKALADGGARVQEDSAFGKHFRETFPKNAELINSAGAGLSKLFKALDPISGRRRGRPSSIRLQTVVDRCLDLFHDDLRRERIVVATDLPLDLPLVRGYEADLMAALLNILDNAIFWLSRSSSDRMISIRAGKSKKYVRIAVSNNGPPIDELYSERLFDPGFSLKNEGSGIGLAIAKEAMRASKGDIAYDPDEVNTTFVIEMQRDPGNQQ